MVDIVALFDKWNISSCEQKQETNLVKTKKHGFNNQWRELDNY